jgi:diguanylate cyclase (GGDEF)-like protein
MDYLPAAGDPKFPRQLLIPTMAQLCELRRRSGNRIQFKSVGQRRLGAHLMSDKILVVDDDPAAIQLMGQILQDLGEVQFATNGADAVRLARESPPDLVLLDAQMPGMSGFKVFDALRELPDLADVPIIFITSHSESEFEIGILEMGATDFIAKPVNPSIVKARVKTHLRSKHLADSLRHIAATDGLTGIANRRQFDDSLQREWLRNRRNGNPLVLLLIDVDHFKLYNDRYGHPKGDACLQEVVSALRSSVRRTADLVARCGGEEFGVLLPETGRSGGECVAQRILAAVAARQIRHEASPTGRHVSVSIGIGCFDEIDFPGVSAEATLQHRDELHRRFSANDLLIAADRALYCAKRSGRAQAQILSIADLEATEPSLVVGVQGRSVERA